MGRKITLFSFKSYIGWECLFIVSQDDLPMPSLMYELMRVLINSINDDLCIQNSR